MNLGIKLFDKFNQLDTHISKMNFALQLSFPAVTEQQIYDDLVNRTCSESFYQ